MGKSRLPDDIPPNVGFLRLGDQPQLISRVETIDMFMMDTNTGMWLVDSVN